MEVSQGESNLGSEELSLVLREHAHLDQVTEEFSALDKLHEEVDTVLILEDILHVDQEGVVDGAQDIFLKLNVFHLFILENDIFADALHREEILRDDVLDKEHLTKCSLAYHLENCKVLQRSRLVLVASKDSVGAACH